MIARLQAVGMIEFNSIAVGIQAADAMLKAAQVAPLIIKTICPGKFVAAVHGDVASVKAAVGAGLDTAGGVAVDHFLLPNIAPEVVSALSCTGEQQPGNAVGVIETYSAASAVVAADTAVKASQVTIMEVRLAMGLGGKAICLLSGDVASVQAAVSNASAAVAETGLLVRQVVISGISPELLPYIM